MKVTQAFDEAVSVVKPENKDPTVATRSLINEMAKRGFTLVEGKTGRSASDYISAEEASKKFAETTENAEASEQQEGDTKTSPPPPIAIPSIGYLPGTGQPSPGTSGQWGDYEKFMKEFMAGKDIQELLKENIARGTPETNLNDKSYEETMRLSRLADIMNNTMYRRGSHSAGGIGAYGGGGIAATVQGRDSSFYKAPIETEEMRQMQQMRDRQAEIDSRRIGRQQTAADLPVEMGRARAVEEMNRAHHAWAMKHDDSYQRAYYTYQQDLEKLKIPPAQIQYLYDWYQKDMAFANLAASIFHSAATMPDWQQAIMSRITTQEIAKVNNGTQTYREAVKNIADGLVDVSKGVMDAGVDIFNDITTPAAPQQTTTTQQQPQGKVSQPPRVQQPMMIQPQVPQQPQTMQGLPKGSNWVNR